MKRQGSTLLTLFCIITVFAFSQSPVTRIYTDFNTFHTSSTASPTSPDVNTQNLLAFQTGSLVWSTGVNNSRLASNEVTYVPLNFNAMPATVVNYSSSALIGIGRQYGGFTSGNGCAPTVSLPHGTNISAYLTDGLNGLDLSTALFNVGGTITYTVSTIDPTSIGDGVPDILVTQVGDLSSTSWDQFRFLTNANALVGNQVSVNFSTVATVSRPYWKFYSLAGACGASNAGTRDMRLLAFDFADLGITAANYATIAKFEHQVTPNSDVAFIAYNTISATILPITLSSFDAQLIDNEVQVSWKTATEINNDYFTVERSDDGQIWEPIIRTDGAGDSNAELSYFETDQSPLPGVSYYRLRQTDFDGNYTMSNIVAIQRNNTGVQIFPNPAENHLTIMSDSVGDLKLVNAMGQDVLNQTTILNDGKNVIQLDIHQLESGYYLVYTNGEVHSLVVK